MNTPTTCPAWKLWANPIIRRYCRSRLRPQALGATVLITVLVTGFVFFMIRTASMHRSSMLIVDAERTPLLTLLGIQAFILFFMGTGQVVGGINTEADEGVLEYQRLTPMTPLAKVLGHWLGLPLREWLSFAATLPFTIWGLWRGQVPMTAWVSVYAVLISSALLYHLTGFTAGMVIKNRRMALMASMSLILLLYTIIPQIAKMGLVFFDYITLWPVLNEHMHHFLPREAGAAVKLMNALNRQVKFFDLEFSSIVFTLFCQGGLALTLGTMVWRRWRSVEAHLLGKAWAVGVFVWIQTLLLGNALPLITHGSLFPSIALRARFQMQNAELLEPTLGEGITVIALYGFTSLLIMLVLTFIITPGIDNQLRGLRRAKKLAVPRAQHFSDAASAFPFVLLLIVIGGVAWSIFAHELMTSRWFPGHDLPALTLLVLVMVLANTTLGFHAALEGWGGRRLFMFVIFIGIVPAMAGFILGTASDGLMPLATWLSAISPISGPALAPAVLVPGSDLPAQVARAVPRAFWFWQSVTVLAVAWLLWQLRAVHRERRAGVK